MLTPVPLDPNDLFVTMTATEADDLVRFIARKGSTTRKGFEATEPVLRYLSCPPFRLDKDQIDNLRDAGLCYARIVHHEHPRPRLTRRGIR